MTGIYKIGVASRKTGLSPATLRLWEDQYGLLTPERTAGGTRLYSDADVQRVRMIRKLIRQRGYTLEAIARILEAAHTSDSTIDRVTIENLQLREATNREFIEEGRRMAEVHTMLRNLTRLASSEQAARYLVQGAMRLTGANRSALGLYDQRTDTLTFVMTARGDQVQTLGRPPLSVAGFPGHWQDALRNRQPYAEADLAGLELSSSLSARAIEDQTRAFHAEPLGISDELVGVLVIGSSRPRGIRQDARAVAERLAVAAGPVIHYFASLR
jgi:MerR family transcriptional regulator/heat shock protein HspR